MAVEAKQVMLYIRKVLRSSIRISYRSASDHPILFSLGLLLYLLYRSSPGFFAFLLSSSPVIICTTLLLGVLLSYGDTNLPEVDDDDKISAEISALKVGTSSSDIHFKANQSFSVPEFKDNKISIKEMEMKEPIFGRERASEHVEPDDDVPLLRGVGEEDERIDKLDRLDKTFTPFPSMINFHREVGMEENMSVSNQREIVDSFFSKDRADKHAKLFEDVLLRRVDDKETAFGLFSSSENVKKDVEMEEKMNQERTFPDSATSETREVFEEKPAEGVAGTSRPVCGVSVRQRKKLAGLKMGTNKAVKDNQLDSSLGSSLARVDSHDGSSGFDSDRAESSSPDASMTDIAPVFDEIDPLLGAESARPDPIPKDDSDGDSHISSQDPQIDDDSNDEAENQEAREDGEENKKDDGKEAAFMWTADDEKNLMDLGYSEMERNRRLETLMARRRSRKNIRFELDKNLIDLDNNDAGRSMDDLSHFRVQVPPISALRRNPFDHPYDSEEAAIPGSAPSILHPRKNPFDPPFDQSNDSDVPARDYMGPREFMTASHRDMFIRRHDSFNIGRTETSQERRFSRLKPFFVPETLYSEEGSTSNFQRQFSDKSESKFSAVTESDTVSSVADQEDHNVLIEKDLHREHESPTLMGQDSELADVGSECSDEINSVDVELDNSDIDDREIPLQHFVFERTQEREAYLASMKGKGHEEVAILEAAGSSMQSLHAVPDLLSWEDGDGESSLGAKSSFEPTNTVEFSEWVSSPKLAEEHESGSGDFGEYLNAEVGSSSNTIVLGGSHPPEKDRIVYFTSHSNDAMLSDDLTHKSMMESSSEFGKEMLPVISRDLHPIPEETVVENFNPEVKHESATFRDSVGGLDGLHVIEEPFAVGSEGSSAVIFSAPTQEGDAIQSPSLDSTESLNSFIFRATKPEEADRVDIKEETTPGYLVDSDVEADKIYPEPIGDNGIDENFLSELDAVGDFRVEQLRLNHEVPDVSLRTDSHANDIAADSLVSPQASGNIFLNLSEASTKDSEQQPPLIDNLKGIDPEFGWSVGVSHGDPEQTVYNPRRRILEASPFEEMNTVFKQFRDETEVPSLDASSAANLEVGSSEPGFTECESILTTTDADMVVLDVRSVEDIETAFKKVSDGVVDKSSIPDNETSQVLNAGMDSEPAEGPRQLRAVDEKSVDDIFAAFEKISGGIVANSLEEKEAKGPRQLHVVDAKSVDDIYAAFEKISGGIVADSLEEKEAKDGHGEAAESEGHILELQPGKDNGTLHAFGGGMELEPMETSSNVSVIAAKSLDDIDAVSKKLSEGTAADTV